MMNRLKKKSKKLRTLLAQQFGTEVDYLSTVLGNEEQVKSFRFNKDDKDLPNDNDKYIENDILNQTDQDSNNLNDDKQAYTDSVYTDSSTFLKGTQSANPHNDYCQHFVDTGQRPQNFIRDVGLQDRFEEYPKLKELIKLKDTLISETASPPMYLKCDLKTFNLKELDCKFDVVLIEPPLEEYQRSCGVTNMQFWSWNEIMSLNLEDVAAQRSFVFLWCGSSDGLDLGRKCLKKWGFRRCEDICWIKTNSKNPKHSKNLEPKAIFQRTKEHCLMGIKGTVRRSTDGDFIHANVDIDLIISEQPEYGSVEKPEEMIHIIEHFCLGKRRLHVFGRDSTIRPGWLTIGPGLTNSNFNLETYLSYFDGNTGHLTGCTERIEALRPKSPQPKKNNNFEMGQIRQNNNLRNNNTPVNKPRINRPPNIVNRPIN